MDEKNIILGITGANATWGQGNPFNNSVMTKEDSSNENKSIMYQQSQSDTADNRTTTIGPTSKDSVPLEGEELEERDDIETFDSQKAYKGEYVKTRAGDDEFILGRAYPQGTGSVFVPCDPSAAVEHMGTFENHAKSTGYATMNTFEQTLSDGKLLFHYLDYGIATITCDQNGKLNALSHISSINKEKEKTNQSYKDKSPYKAAYEVDNSLINLAMAIEGIFGTVLKATKLTKLPTGGIKIAKFVNGAIGLERTMQLSLSAIGSMAAAGAYGLMGGAAINNIIGKPLFDNFNSKNGTNKQKGNFGEAAADENMVNNQKVKDAGYDLESVGREAPTGPDDKIVKGIDGLYKNKNADSDIKYVIDEAKFGKSQLGTTKDGPQMSDDWLRGSDRILKAVNEDEELADDILEALDNDQVERVLSKIDSDGNVTTHKLNSKGEIVGTWP